MVGSPESLDPAAALRLFVRRLWRRHVRSASLAAGLRALLLLAVPAIPLLWLLDGHRLALLAAVCAVGAGAAVAAGLRHALAFRQRVALAAAGADFGPGVDRLADELTTWLEHERRGGGDRAMVAWLATDVAARLPLLAPPLLRAAGRPRLGRWLWLLPLALLLLFGFGLSAWLAPPWAGVFGGRLDRALADSGGGGQGAGGGAGAAGAGLDPARGDERQPDRPPAPPPAPAGPEPESEQGPEPEPEPPAPLLELPEQQRFVVPEFIGDGPTRRARMHAAEIEPDSGAAGGRAAAAARPPDPGPAPDATLSFERAAETALRARHVPPAERPMVRRFFELLREAAR